MQTLRILLIAAIIAVSAGVFWFAYQSGILGPQTSQVLRGTGAPQLGGPFELVNQWGEPTSSADFAGSHILVFFGYTYCPDVCPLTLARIATALDILGDEVSDVVPVFITVDPVRDTPEQIRDYVSHFHPAIVGLTGTDEQIASVARAYGVYYAKVQDGEADGLDDYLVDHTSITYLMTPDNRYAAHFSHSATADEIANGVRQILSNG